MELTGIEPVSSYAVPLTIVVCSRLGIHYTSLAYLSMPINP